MVKNILQTPHLLTIKTGMRHVFIKTHDIVSIKAHGTHSTITMADGQTYQSQNRLKTLTGLLPDFILRVHRSHLVNMYFIKELVDHGKPELVMRNQQIIPLTKKNKKPLLTQMYGELID